MKAKAIKKPRDYLSVVRILYACGKDMGKKYNLHHWDNPWLKTFIIVVWSSFNNRVFIVEDGRNAIATYQTKTEQNTLHFEKLAVLPTESGKGIGSHCLQLIENEAVERGCTKVQMDVYSKSSHALEFYFKHGYKTVGDDKTLKYNVICMEKDLAI